ncbi:MAG: DUF192 domain-containing protein [Planctomycetaceae bacterium]
MANWGGPLTKVGSNTVVAERIELADSFCSRFLGLQFRRSLPMGTGILLTPCRSIHTHWMRFAIDIAFLGDGGEVLSVYRDIRPWRTLNPRDRRVRGVLEMCTGTLSVEPGDRLQLQVAGEVRASLSWLSAE